MATSNRPCPKELIFRHGVEELILHWAWIPCDRELITIQHRKIRFYSPLGALGSLLTTPTTLLLNRSSEICLWFWTLEYTFHSHYSTAILYGTSKHQSQELPLNWPLHDLDKFWTPGTWFREPYQKWQYPLSIIGTWEQNSKVPCRHIWSNITGPLISNLQLMYKKAEHKGIIKRLTTSVLIVARIDSCKFDSFLPAPSISLHRIQTITKLSTSMAQGGFTWFGLVKASHILWSTIFESDLGLVSPQI